MATDYISPKPDKPIPKDTELAAEVIRNKINSLYMAEAKEKTEPNAELEENEVERLQHLSRHQRYMRELINSGKSQAEIQTAWHIYYVGLSDDQKHQVWQEFYSNQKAVEQAAEKTKPPSKKSEKKVGQRTVDQVKKQIYKSVNSGGKLKAKHHFQSIFFGLGIGSFAVIILLFGFFNERIIAPFITPSRNVTSTPIISGSGSVANSTPTIIIPKINVEIPVVYDQSSIDESAIETSLESGVVHYATTSSPGEQGNTVIFGHSSNNILNKGKYKFAFVLLNRLQVGDTFTLTKDGKRYVYQIYERKIVKPTEVSVLGPTGKTATVTLITCDPPGTSINRLVVIGEQISPSPSTNVASTAIKSNQTPTVVPSNSQSLWQRIKALIS
ncbi:MAG: class D sortase [Candidatus Saccharibacteria bacterium]